MIVAILPKVCINYKNGCRENYETDHQVLDHETNCPFRSIKCPLKGCQDGKSQMIYKDLLDHIKKKSKKRVLKLRSETCSALNKLEYVSLKKDLTKTKETFDKLEPVVEEP